jgi:asparagine synthase (glutamine-hydrolysing)
MCGISGIMHFNQSPVSVDTLKRMTDAISHRGPDGEGIWANAGKNIALGHRRLSIIDLSEGGKQPMHYLDRYTITFNGEIYNYVELKADLMKRGYRFQSASDTEVLLALYDCFREKCLDQIDGMFAFAIWDEKQQELFCARDRFGEKPFYYSRDKDRFLFASEMKALFAAGVPKKYSTERLHYYLAFNYEGDPAEGNSTFYEHIDQLQPASFLFLKKDGSFVVKKYWSIDAAKSLDIPIEEASEQFLELFTGSISRRLRSDVAVGSSLSGGLDSSAVVLLIDAMKREGQIQKTFSARFKDFEKDEGKYIDLVLAKAKKVEPHYIWPEESLVTEELDKIFYHQEEPFGSASILAQWSVMRLAKENNVTVLLDGQGADEILAGYHSYFSAYLNQLLGNNFSLYKTEKEKISGMHGFAHEPGWRTRTMLRRPKLWKMASGAAKLFSAKQQPQNGQSFRDLYKDEFYGEVQTMRNPGTGESFDNLRQYQKKVIERSGFLQLLRYADRNSMAFSREVRLPFLDHKLVEFCLALPDQFKISNGWTKYLLRFAMKDVLPEEITWRKDKIGFVAPQEKWMSSSRSREMVSESRHVLSDAGIIREDAKLSDWKCLMAARTIKG